MNRDLLRRNVNAFFEYLYFMPSLGIFHKATTYKLMEVSERAELVLICV
jgi:hypothetical protein